MLSLQDQELLLRAVLAAVLGFAIGRERESRGHPAGDRTYALIGLGTSAFTTLSIHLSPANADRMVAGVITGVGFLGAGTILRFSTGEVRGLTTAASVWAVASLGTVVGSGRCLLGVLLGGLILLILMCERLPLLSRLIGPTHRQQDNTQD